MSHGAPKTSNYSIAIAGAGIIGMSAAWRLAQNGWRVTVFDRGPIGGEASWAGAGMLSLGGEIEAGSPLAAWAFESRRLYRDFVRELQESSGIEIDYQECGALDLAYSQEELERLNRRAAAQAAIGINSKLLDLGQVTAFWPRVRREGFAGARFYSDDAIVNPRELVAALEVVCRRAGVCIIPHCAVTRIDVSANSVALTMQGLRNYDIALVAAGAWSSTIPVTGVPALPASEPVKGHLIGYPQPKETCSTIIRHGHTYLLQRENGVLIVGASVEHVGFDRHIDPQIAGQIASQGAFVMPHLGETTPTKVWAGFRPASDELHVGRWNSPRLYLAYGHFRNGILLAPATAARLVEMLGAGTKAAAAE